MSVFYATRFFCSVYLACLVLSLLGTGDIACIPTTSNNSASPPALLNEVIIGVKVLQRQTVSALIVKAFACVVCNFTCNIYQN